MDVNRIKELKENFENHSQEIEIEGQPVEIWFARDLQNLLEYTRWESFAKVILRASDSAKNAGEEEADHFREVTKMVKLGSGAEREIKDVMLTRYACYLIAQNGDPSKEAISFAQNYFAIQTRKLEVLQERIEAKRRLEARKKLTEQEKLLSANIYERGVDNQGFGRIRSKGDQAFFGGLSTGQMKIKLKVPKGRALADFLPRVSILGKALAAELTNINAAQKELYGEGAITEEHITNNLSVRQLLLDRGVIPENLPPAEDIKKLERRLKKGDKEALKEINRLTGKS